MTQNRVSINGVVRTVKCKICGEKGVKFCIWCDAIFCLACAYHDYEQEPVEHSTLMVAAGQKITAGQIWVFPTE